MFKNVKELEIRYTAHTIKDGARRILASDSFVPFVDGITNDESIDATNGASPTIAPHLYIPGTGVQSVRVTVMTENTARVTFKDGHKETMRRGFKMGELIIDEYARNTSNGARIYRTVSVVANGARVVLEETTATYDGASVETVYAPTARRVSLATTKAGAFRPRKVTQESTARMFAASMLASFIAVAHAHGNDGTHFDMTVHVKNSATQTADVVHGNGARKKAMSGARRRKLRKLRAAMQANN